MQAAVKNVAGEPPAAVEPERGCIGRRCLSCSQSAVTNELAVLSRSEYSYPPLPKLKNANDSTVALALEVCDPLWTGLDIGRPTRAGLEASPNGPQPRLLWYHNRGVLIRPAARCL